jgi:hypothetical protein
MKFISQIFFFLVYPLISQAQIKWKNVDSLYFPLPGSVHVYCTDDSLDNAPFRAFYLIADLKDKRIEFTTDTSRERRLTPQKFFERNEKALAVVNCTFFSFETNRNLNVVIKDGQLVGYNIHTLNGRGKDTFTYRHTLGSALGISKRGKTDIAWIYTDSTRKYASALQAAIPAVKDSVLNWRLSKKILRSSLFAFGYPGVSPRFQNWKMKTAVGGGPVVVQDGEIKITNEEELKFTGKAINDKHPRTAMGYTKDEKLIILVIEGRNPKAAGATLIQEAQIFKDLGCWEALNLDGGGSSCLLVNGKETIKPSDAAGQRPVPAVFIIKLN